jgi:hypothetical protein
MPVFLFFCVFGFSQKLFDYKNDKTLDLAEMSKVQYISVAYENIAYRLQKTKWKADYETVLKWRVNYGEKDHLFIFDEAKIELEDNIALCNYLYSFGWSLVTANTSVSGIEGMSSSSTTYIFKRRN